MKEKEEENNCDKIYITTLTWQVGNNETNEYPFGEYKFNDNQRKFRGRNFRVTDF